MTISDDAHQKLRDEVGRAMGFVLGVVLGSARDGKTATPAELCLALEQYRVRFKAFTPEVEEIIRGMLHGLTFALHDESMTTQRL